MTRPLLVLVILLASCGLGCTHLSTSPSPRHEVVLFVGNQSHHETPVDIAVYVDGKLLTKGYHHVGFGQDWIRFATTLEEGEHELVARSVVGQAEFTETLQLPDDRWIVIDYWYRPSDYPQPLERQLKFAVYDQPVFTDERERANALPID